jgi:hypothetical protein
MAFVEAINRVFKLERRTQHRRMRVREIQCVVHMCGDREGELTERKSNNITF